VAKRKRPQVAVFFSDTHVGSTVGIMPHGFVTLNGNHVQPNKLQAWLYECWEDAWFKWLPSYVGDDPYVLVCGGDVIEGIHHGTTEIWSPDLSDQSEAALRLYRPIVERAEKFYMVRGTEVHTGSSSEIRIGSQLGACPNPDTGLAAWDKLVLDIHGTRLHYLHHVSTTTRTWLEASGPWAAMMNDRSICFDAGQQPPRVCGYGHRHKAIHVRNPGGLAFVTHPWQGLTRFGYKVAGAAITMPGITVLDWRGLPEGSVPLYQSSPPYTPAAPTGAVV